MIRNVNILLTALVAGLAVLAQRVLHLLYVAQQPANQARAPAQNAYRRPPHIRNRRRRNPQRERRPPNKFGFE